MKNDEQIYLGMVAGLGCALCSMLGFDGTPAEVHHLREGQGGSQRSPHWLTVPLCPSCHRGQHGVHGDRQRLRQAKTDEMGLLAWTIEKIFRLRNQ